METRIVELAEFLGREPRELLAYRDELEERALAADIHERARRLPEFAAADLRDVPSFSFFRTMLYLAVRAERPRLFVETGVLNGFSSAFILQAMEDNGSGSLVSIDLPSRGLRLAHEGTRDLPESTPVGWAIPDRLRHRHELLLGRSELLLPGLFARDETPEIFLHDSLHTYNHMVMELSLAISFMQPGTLLICDNTERNASFTDVCRGNELRSIELASYDSVDRVWKHGLARLP